MINEGDEAPDFELPTDGGGKLALGELRGEPVVIYFYPKDDTSGCTKEAVAFSELLSEFSTHGAKVIGISPDSVARHDKFKTKHGLSVTLAADTEKAVARCYGVWVQKSMYGRAYMGVERSTFLIGPDGRVVRIWRKVKVPGHVENVLDAVRQLAR